VNPVGKRRLPSTRQEFISFFLGMAELVGSQINALANWPLTLSCQVKYRPHESLII
jgi:hypothetical protein